MFALWLLSQTLGFGGAGLFHESTHITQPSAICQQTLTINCGYDRSQCASVVYDVAGATPIPLDCMGTVVAAEMACDYDRPGVLFFLKVESSRAPPWGFDEFLAAETTAARTASGDFYSVAFETELSPTSYPGVSRYMHFKEANTALDAAMNADADFAATMDQLGISVPRSSSGSILGTSPENWVWHHDTEAGIMQLVPKSQHPNIPGGIFWETMHPGGNGGFSIWGQ